MEKLNVVFIPSKVKQEIPWGADIFLNAVKKYSKHRIIEHYGFNNLGFDCSESLYENADIIHLHNLASTALDGHLPFLRRSRIKEYVNAKDRPVFIGGIRGYRGFKKGVKYLKYFDCVHVGNIDLMIRVSRYNSNTNIIYPGVDVDLFKPLKFEPSPFTVLWVGDLGKKIKNADLLYDMPFPVNVASKENYIKHEDMPGFYNSGHVLISLSEKEGFCRPIIEAMACGLPVISTKTGIAPYILENRFLIDNPRTEKGFNQLYKTLFWLSRHEKKRKLTGSKNRIISEKFSWKTRIRVLDRLWEKKRAPARKK